MRILCIGDSQTDVDLAKNIDGLIVEGVSVEVVAFICEHDTTSDRQDYHSDIVRRYRTWQELELACLADVRQEQGIAQFLIIDVDRTLLLPKGICDIQMAHVGWSAFRSYALQFVKPGTTVTNIELRDAYDKAKRLFRPYTERTSLQFNDEDARVFAGLGLTTGLLLENELGADPSFSNSVGTAWKRCRLGGWNPIGLDGCWKSPDERWLQNALEEELKNQLIQLKMKDCCVAQRYRAEEEKRSLS